MEQEQDQDPLLPDQGPLSGYGSTSPRHSSCWASGQEVMDARIPQRGCTIRLVLLTLGLCVVAAAMLVFPFNNSYLTHAASHGVKDSNPSMLPQELITDCCFMTGVTNRTKAVKVAASPLQHAARMALAELGVHAPSRANAVIYMVWQSGRTDRLAMVLRRFDRYFNRAFQYPVMVYYHDADLFTNEDRVKLQASSSVTLVFFPLPALDMMAPHEALQYLAVDLPASLAYDYEWQLQLNDNLLLTDYIKIDPFLLLGKLNARVGYVDKLGLQLEQVARTWFLGQAFALVSGLHHQAIHQDKGQHTLAPQVLISHRDVWASTDLMREFVAFLRGDRRIDGWVEPTSMTATLQSVVAMMAVGEHELQALHMMKVEGNDRKEARRFSVDMPILGVAEDVAFRASQASDLQPLFNARKKGWIGADVATSFLFPPSPSRVNSTREYMWLFGDTLIGRTMQGGETRAPGAFFIHNSVAFVPKREKAAATVDPNMVEFAWNVSTSTFCPRSIFVGYEDKDECNPDPRYEYQWPVSGMGVQYVDEETNEVVSKLIILSVTWTYGGPDPVLAFTIVGTSVIVVDNPHDSPQAWSYRQKLIPGTDGDHNWYSAMAMADPTQSMARSLDDVLYIVGNNGSTVLGPPETISKAILSRVSVRSLVDLSFEDMEIWAHTGQGKPTKWVNQAEVLEKGLESVPLFYPMFSETSLVYNPALKSWYMPIVDLLANAVLLYTAPDVTGPWTSTKIYNIPMPYSDTSMNLCYAGKSHPELAGDDEIILTFVANAMDVTDLFDKGASSIYVPRFLRVKFK